MVDVASETRAESDKRLAGIFLGIAAKLLQQSTSKSAAAMPSSFDIGDLDALIDGEGLNQDQLNEITNTTQ
jgi:hypothetical protein